MRSKTFFGTHLKHTPGVELGQKQERMRRSTAREVPGSYQPLPKYAGDGGRPSARSGVESGLGSSCGPLCMGMLVLQVCMLKKKNRRVCGEITEAQRNDWC